MKVILLRDVARLGRKSEVKEVPDGHAINFLIPRKLAVIATKENLDRVTEAAGKHAEAEQSQIENFKKALAACADRNITHHMEANEQGHLFKGIRVDDVVAILHQHGFALSKQHVVLDAPIKSTGVHTIQLVYSGVKGSVRLEVIKK